MAASWPSWGSSRRQYSNSNGEFPFAEHKKNIVAGLHDAAKAMMDASIMGVLHPHTGTVIEKLGEVFAVLDSMDTKYVKFGPDVGQMVKGGAPPQAVTKLVQDSREIIHHMHLKDYSGGRRTRPAPALEARQAARPGPPV
jgi:inosose dehydratase